MNDEFSSSVGVTSSRPDIFFKAKLHGSPIAVGDLAQTFPNFLASKNFSKITVLADSNTRRDCLPIFFKKIKTDAPPVIEIPVGEIHKNLDTCRQVWQAMLDLQLDRNSLVVLLGGGVVGDLGAFCAATFKRGIQFVQVPTTLLAMTDAAVGGKNGIDFQLVKNLVGTFRQPAAVLADTDFLKTLPERELRSGFAEVLKHAEIGSPALRRQIEKLENLTQADWQNLLPKSLDVKIRVVRKDPEERGLRAILNFGHTIGHALESYFLQSPAPILHGEAVAAGMICERFLQSPDDAGQLARLVFRFFPKIEISKSDTAAVWQWIQHDKKKLAGRVKMMLPTDGRLGFETLAPTRAEVERALEFYAEAASKML